MEIDICSRPSEEKVSTWLCYRLCSLAGRCANQTKFCGPHVNSASPIAGGLTAKLFCQTLCIKAHWRKMCSTRMALPPHWSRIWFSRGSCISSATLVSPRSEMSGISFTITIKTLQGTCWQLTPIFFRRRFLLFTNPKVCHCRYLKRKPIPKSAIADTSKGKRNSFTSLLQRLMFQWMQVMCLWDKRLYGWKIMDRFRTHAPRHYLFHSLPPYQMEARKNKALPPPSTSILVAISLSGMFLGCRTDAAQDW